MPPKKQKKVGYGAPVVLGAYGGLQHVGVEQKAREGDKQVKHLRDMAHARGEHTGSGDFEHFMAGHTGDGKPVKSLSRAEHKERSQAFDRWTTRRGPRYPYMNAHLNQHAGTMSRFHAAAAAGKTTSGGGPYTSAAEAGAKQIRTFRAVGHGVGAAFGAAAIGTGVAIHHHNSKVGVKKSMDEVSKDFREELHRRATDGRFQAGAAGGAGAGLAALSVRSGNRRAAGHREAAQPHLHEAAAQRKTASGAEDLAGFYEGRKGRKNARDAQSARKIMWESKAEAFGHEIKANAHLKNAANASRKGKASAAIMAGTGAAAAGGLLYRHHKQNQLNNDLREIAVEKNLSAEEIFSKARMERSHWAGAKHGAKIGGAIGGGLGALQGAAVGAHYGASPAGHLALAAAGGAGGAVEGGTVGGLIGAAVGRKVPKKKKVAKNADPVEILFDAARGDEVSKAMWNDAVEAAGKLGEKTKSTMGGKPYVKNAFNATKTAGKKAWAGGAAYRTKPALTSLGVGAGAGALAGGGVVAAHKKSGTNGTNL